MQPSFWDFFVGNGFKSKPLVNGNVVFMRPYDTLMPPLSGCCVGFGSALGCGVAIPETSTTEMVFFVRCAILFGTLATGH
jgi:hypothetical protein